MRRACGQAISKYIEAKELLADQGSDLMNGRQVHVDAFKD